jgi:hypothetical protein
MSKPSLRVSVFLLAAALAVAPAWPHEGGIDMRGEVVSADAKQVTVRSGDGHEQRYALTPQTRITVGGIVGTAADLTPGLRAVVHSKKVVDVVTAASVQLGSPKEPVGSKRPSAP